MPLIASLIDIPSDRLSLAILDSSSGFVVLNILPRVSLNVLNLYGTMWSSSFSVVGYSSISIPNASLILLGCGIDFAAVDVVDGTLVIFQANNITINQTECLRNDSRVAPTSITIPGRWQNHIFHIYTFDSFSSLFFQSFRFLFYFILFYFNFNLFIYYSCRYRH